MKKPGLIITVLSAVLTILSCDPKYYTVTVENQSAKPVTYTYNDIKTADLTPGASKEYHVEAYTLPPGEISVAGAASVEMESQGSGERYVFKDRKSLILQVENKLSEDVYLTADKYIDTSASTLPSPPLTDADYISLGLRPRDTTPPEKPDDLRKSFYTKREKDVIEFNFGDSGKTAYFAVQIENEGKKDPWGPLVSALIP
jgi:hypothetical protein